MKISNTEIFVSVQTPGDPTISTSMETSFA